MMITLVVRSERRQRQKRAAKRAGVVLTLVAGFTAASGSAQQAGPPTGYLVPGAFDILKVLPPAPQRNDPRDKADRAIFRKTRALVGTPRYALATSDVNLSAADMLHDYSCAMRVSLTPDNAPITAAFVKRASIDTIRNTNLAKVFYKHPRPFVGANGPTCQPKQELAASYDYPSGHATLGWTWAMLLARLAPDRATDILARGRAFADSRVVCGVHNLSAVQGGMLSATVTLDTMLGHATFVGDEAAARREITALRTNSATPRPDPASCAAEAALVAQRVY